MLLDERMAQLCDDEMFRAIDNQVNKFNLFEALGATRSELRHSNFLGFLLSPNRSHRIGSAFLQHFLRMAVGQCRPDVRPISTLELIVGDLDSSVIYREKDNIDLLIEIPPLRLVVVVENKIGASVGDGQLQRYKSLIQARYASFRHLFVLLTPEGEDPDAEDWAQLSYSDVANVH